MKISEAAARAWADALAAKSKPVSDRTSIPADDE